MLTKTELNDLIDTNLPDNTVKSITEEIMRDTLKAIVSEMDEYEEVLLSSSDVLQLGSVPKQILPAPGSEKFINIKKIILEFITYGAGYTISSTDLVITNNDYLPPILYKCSTELIKYTSSQFAILENTAGENNQYLAIANTSLILKTIDDVDPTLGNGEIIVKIWYKVETFGTNL